MADLPGSIRKYCLVPRQVRAFVVLGSGSTAPHSRVHLIVLLSHYKGAVGSGET